MQDKSQNKPTHNSPFIPHHSALTPVYFWQGARPTLTALEAHQTGWLVCLSLTREGDFCLLPLAWEENTPQEDTIPIHTIPTPTLNTQALNETAVSQTLADLQSAGWAINGRFTITFHGQDTISNFQQNIQSYLWQTPIKKDEL